MSMPDSSPALTATARILLVDDHPVVRGGVRALLADEPDILVCGEAGTGREAIQLLGTLNPDLVLLDLSLPDMDGIELIKDIRARFPDVRVLVLSLRDEAVYAERALHAGALGFLTKGKPRPEILHAIRKALEGHVYVSQDLADRVIGRGLVGGHPDAVTPAVSELSDRELQVFTAIGQGLGPREIAEKLHLSPRTIETYRAHIRRKLHLDDAAALRHYAVEWMRTQE
ncbi:MAG TPA: response regulator transcription factor [Planctomycetota bacterium]|nr:response regulator transcription factor [Planctomycetota bacterium]HRR81206.1 response regulator transcription factor [Planctomycetota bacterium]HRT97190.1 response regulator transcription factor [Planctomycetota bacterium]